MLSADETRKPGQRKGKRKAGSPAKAAGQQPAGTVQPPVSPAESSRQAAPEASHEITTPIAPVVAAESPLAEASRTDVAVAEPAGPVPVTVQTVASAYGDYTRKSLEHAFAFVGKLASARSPAEVFALQMEFAKQACESFLAESQRIGELHGELARQGLMRFEGVVARITHTTVDVRATRH